MESHIYVLGGFGLLILLVAWFPIFIRNLPLTLPIICVAVGYAIFAVAGDGDAADHLALPVELDHAATLIRAELDARHIAQQNRHPARGLDLCEGGRGHLHIPHDRRPHTAAFSAILHYRLVFLACLYQNLL